MKLRNIINTRLNHIKLKERCLTPYKHFPIIHRKEDNNIEKKCCWCDKTVNEIADENNLDRMDLWAFYKTQIEIV